MIGKLFDNLNGKTNKFISLIVIVIVVIGMVTVFVYDSITGRNIPDFISSFMYAMVGSIVGYSIHALGVDSGKDVTLESATKINNITSGTLPIVMQDKKE